MCICMLRAGVGGQSKCILSLFLTVEYAKWNPEHIMWDRLIEDVIHILLSVVTSIYGRILN